jgi:adenine-specific DNA-methyltransferase
MIAIQIYRELEDHFSEWRLIGLREAFQRSYKMVSWDDVKAKYADKLEDKLAEFVVANASRVVRTARVAPKDVNESARDALALSNSDRGKVFCSVRDDKDDYYFLGGEQLIFYKSKIRVIDGISATASPLTNLWDDLLSNNLHNEGEFPFQTEKSRNPSSKDALNYPQCREILYWIRLQGLVLPVLLRTKWTALDNGRAP